MGKRYETGTKNHVIRMALLHAIDDRESMVDGYRNPNFEPNATPDHPYYKVVKDEFGPEDVEYIEGVKAELRDFRKMVNTLRGK